MNAALRLAKYLKSKQGLGYLMSCTSSNTLIVFCDANWGSCVNDRRSVTGYIVQHG